MNPAMVLVGDLHLCGTIWEVFVPRFGGFGLLPRCRGLLLVLPKEIDPDSGSVRLSQGGRRLKATFKVIN